jgi:hypothetical protein
MQLTLKLAALVILCFIASGVAAQDDKVRIQGIDAGEEVLMAMSARKAPGQGCFDADERKWIVVRADATGHVSIPNLGRGCVLTVAAFSRKRAMLLKTLSGWKDQAGEVKTVTMKPPIAVPVVIWITDNALEGIAYRSVANMAERYRDNMVGFNFVPMFRNVSGDSVKVDRIQRAVTPHPTVPQASVCSDLALLKGHAYKAKTLNVYYVKREGLHRNCAIRETPLCDPSLLHAPRADGNVTYLGVDLPNELVSVFPHELGHALGLRPICNEFGANWGHPLQPNPGFDDTNLMVGAGGDKRVKLTLGQVFRMNTTKDEWGGTMIIANQLRPGPGRRCRLKGQEHSTYECPPLNLTFETQ